MIHLARRHFFNARNEIHWNKNWRKTMGGINLDGYIESLETSNDIYKDVVQNSIDSLNAAIARLDKIISEMDEKCKH